ncbi:MAG TPA: CocE/NonD family hydrolase [Thermoanaerobaculia bacterium]|nr:CocE/NonD family hydrolase [Thermoanaerobaculia bacterium]
MSLLAFLLAVSLRAAGPQATAPLVDSDVAVPMRDGVKLRADVYRPARSGRFPTLVERTPYNRKRLEDGAILKAALARGYAVVLEDVRGRYGSDGVFVPYVHEGRDGYDTIEWAAAQPWSDGRVGTFGLSYPGALQWLAAIESPPHLQAMVPAMTFSTPRNFFYAGGAFDLSWIPWIWNNVAPDVREKKGLEGPRTGRQARAAWENLENVLPFRLPLSNVPELRDVAPYYFEWLEHRPGEAWWDWAELRGRYGRVTAAVLNVSGWHDEAYGPEGAITNFLGLLDARRGEQDPRTRLVLGPWEHGGIESEKSGDRSFGAAAKLDEKELVLRFLDRYVRGVDNGLDAEPRVRAFVMGENAWRSGETFPLAGTAPISLYLAPGGRLTRQAPAAQAAASRFESDPNEPVVDPNGAATGARDARALARRPDVLVFETEPLAEGLRVLGAVETEIYLSSDAPDVDLWVKLEDVEPDGTAWNLSSPGTDVLRASERDGGADRKPLEAGRPVVLRLPNLRTGNLFARGHRIRVVLCGSFLPHFSRNLQTGELEAVSSRAVKASIEIHHDSEHPSRLVLPILAGEGAR